MAGFFTTPRRKSLIDNTVFLRNEHHRKPNAKTKNDNDAVQFLLEVNLTTIGTMQIEGRIKNKELDLIIRTRNF